MRRQFLVCFTVLSLMIGCGGDSGSETTDPTPTPTPPPNTSPTANAGEDQMVYGNDKVTLDASGSSDADGTISSYAWTQSAGTAAALSNINVAMPSFTAPAVSEAEVLTFTVTVTDDDGSTAQDSVNIMVNPNPDNSLPESAFETAMLLNTLYFEFADRIGEKVWVLGYYGNTGINPDSLGYLVQNMLQLDVDEEQPRHSFARVNGMLPPDGWHGNQVLMYGEIKDYGAETGQTTGTPTPLLTVESYELISEFEQQTSWLNTLLTPDVAPENIVGANPERLFPQLFYDDLRLPIDTSFDTVTGTQAQDCDRSLIISGGINDSANHERYVDNVKAKFSKMKALGFSDDQIQVFYNDGGEIQVDGSNIVNSRAGKEAIQDHLMTLAQDMPGSCTLTVFVTDHGTGHDPTRNYRGARPAFEGEEASNGAMYDENTFSYDARSLTYLRSASFVVVRQKWFVTKDEANGALKLYRRVGNQWQLQGQQGNEDEIISEAELNFDLDGDGNIEDDFGFDIERLEARLTDRAFTSNSWDSDRDGNVDIRVRHDDSRFVFERLVGNQWMEMGRDSNGDFFIDIIDGGVDWNLDGDAADTIAFHEGINLWGNEVLWDDEFAEKLKALSEKGVHVMMEMVSCYSGGFVPNVQDYVENIYTGSSEETLHYNRWIEGKYVATDEIEFLNNLPGIDTDSWNAAAQAATAADDTQADEQNARRNIHVHEQTRRFETGSLYSQSGESDEYLIALDLPDEYVGQIYDYEFILGLQKPRWSSVSFPDGLPTNQQTEDMPGGIRVFSDDPIEDNQLVRVKAEGIELTESDQIRIEFTDVNHARIGYHMVSQGEVEEPAKQAEFSSPKACVNHTDHGQSSPSILEFLMAVALLDDSPLVDVAVTVRVTIPDGSTSTHNIVLTPEGQMYLLFQIFSFGNYNLEVIGAQLVPTSEALELVGLLNFPFTVTATETNKDQCAP